MRVFAVLLLIAASLRAAQPGKDLYFPIAGRATGAGGLHYFTAIWVTNVSAKPAHVRLEFLRTNETNPSPTPFAEEFRLAPEETRIFDNVTEGTLRVKGLGALRIRSDVPLVATARLYSKREGEGGASTLAMSYPAIPAQFAIGNGESTMLQGVSQNADFRYNVSMVETTGHAAGLRLTLLDLKGAVLGGQSYVLRGHEQRTASVASLFPGIAVENGVLVVRGLTGSGKVIAVGSQVAGQSADGSAFVMSYPIRRRMQIAPAELAVYLVSGVALLAAALAAFRRRVSSRA